LVRKVSSVPSSSVMRADEKTRTVIYGV
jgi:hypothetical protein